MYCASSSTAPLILLLFSLLHLMPRAKAGGDVLPNIALGKRTRASVNAKGGWGAQHLVDGWLTTCWDVNTWKPMWYDGISTRLAGSSLIGDQLTVTGWAVVDLQGTYRITSCKVFPYSFRLHGPQLVTSFAIQYWDEDGWSEILESYQVVTNDSPVSLSFGPVMTSKIRVYTYSGIKFAPIAELELYGVPARQVPGRRDNNPGLETRLGKLIGRGDHFAALHLIGEELDRTRGAKRGATLLVQKALVLQRIGALREALSIWRRLSKSKSRRLRRIRQRAIKGMADIYFLENQFQKARDTYLALERIARDTRRKSRFLKEINLRATRWRMPRRRPTALNLAEMYFREGVNTKWRFAD